MGQSAFRFFGLVVALEKLRSVVHDETVFEFADEVGHLVVNDIIYELDVVVFLRGCIFTIQIALGYFSQGVLKTPEWSFLNEVNERLPTLS